MGRLRTRQDTADLPPGMIARVRPSGTHYFLSRPRGDRREEIPLGKVLQDALAEYRSLNPSGTPHDHPDVARELYRRFKKGARQRSLEFSLTVADVQRMLTASGGRCAVTGIPFDMAKPDGARKRLWAPSIDRVDSTRGYVTGNVRMVAIAVNIAMSDFGEEFLLRIAHAIIRRRADRHNLRNIAEHCGIAEVGSLTS